MAFCISGPTKILEYHTLGGWIINKYEMNKRWVDSLTELLLKLSEGDSLCKGQDYERKDKNMFHSLYYYVWKDSIST